MNIKTISVIVGLVMAIVGPIVSVSWLGGKTETRLENLETVIVKMEKTQEEHGELLTEVVTELRVRKELAKE